MNKRISLTLDSSSWLSNMFKAVEDAVEAACKKAGEMRLECAANYADLHCVSVAYCIGPNDEQWWQAEVSEAAPDAWPLANFIHDECAKSNLDVRVLMEW